MSIHDSIHDQVLLSLERFRFLFGINFISLSLKSEGIKFNDIASFMSADVGPIGSLSKFLVHQDSNRVTGIASTLFSFDGKPASFALCNACWTWLFSLFTYSGRTLLHGTPGMLGIDIPWLT